MPKYHITIALEPGRDPEERLSVLLCPVVGKILGDLRAVHDRQVARFNVRDCLDVKQVQRNRVVEELLVQQRRPVRLPELDL